MSSLRYQNLPIVYALDEQGRLRHVDDVDNGLACHCTCLSPGCHAPLIAKNQGRVLAHHFAHKAGSGCEWALESTLTMLAEQAIKRVGVFYLPGCALPISPAVPARVLPALRVEQMQLPNWGAPVLRVTCQAADEELDFLYVLAWHPLSDELRQEVAKLDMDAVAVDLRYAYSRWKKSQMRHSNASDFLLSIQAASTVESMVSERFPGVQWLLNHRAQAEEAQVRRAQAEYYAELARQREEEKRARERAWLDQQAAKEREQAALQAKKDHYLHQLQDFCECNGLTLLEVKGAGRVVECPYHHKQISFGQTDYGCCVCSALVRDFRTHIACAAAE